MNQKNMAEQIIEYWFGQEQSNLGVNQEKSALWWSKNEHVDAEIQSQFSPYCDQALNGELDHWQQSASGLLATILVTDQFPRNSWREQPRSFHYDEFALRCAKLGIETAFDEELPLIYRVFLYLPFEHSEEIEDQTTSLKLYQRLIDESSEEERTLFTGFYDFAVKHFAIIERFGRFPHRNEILGRISTPDEIEFLSQPGSSF